MTKTNDMFSLLGSVALVTGATGHLGREIVLGLAELGAKVIVQGRNLEKVKSYTEELKSRGYSVEMAIFDVKNEDEISQYFSQFNRPHLDILVNNAYAGKAGSIETSTLLDYQESYQIAVTAAAMMMKYALPFMKGSSEQNRSIINIASMYGMVSPDFTLYEREESFNPPFYGAAKAGLIQLTKYAAANLAKYNIRVNSISPGAFPAPEAQQNKKLIDGIIRKNLMGRHGRADELKGPVAFLASSASSYVTGTNLVVDGGWTTT